MPQNKITFEEIASLCPDIEYEWFDVFKERPVSGDVRSELRYMLNDHPWLFELCLYQKHAAALLIYLEWHGDGPHPWSFEQVEIAAGRLIAQKMRETKITAVVRSDISSADLLSICEFCKASKDQVLIYLSENQTQIPLMVNLAHRARVARAGSATQLAMGGFTDG